MSRVLAYTSPARGHLFPLTPILEQLASRGHRVFLRTLSAEVETLRARGVDAAPIAPGIESIEQEDWRARSPIGAGKMNARTFCARALLDAPDLQKAIEEVEPDGLLIDIATWGALSAAEAWDGPVAAFCPFPLPLPSREAPAFGPGLPPARGPLGRLRDRVLWGAVQRGFDGAARASLNDLRKGLGLPALRHAHELFLAPPLLLYMTAEPFEPPRSDWPRSVVMVGPCAWDPPAELPDELVGVEQPLVLVTTSSEFQNDTHLVRTAVEALAGEPLHVVATLPSARSLELDTPSNATVLPFVPHGPILERSVCAVTHGGMGATQKALARGVPVCAVPFGRDQFEVARRVEVAGAGSRVMPWARRPARLRTAVRAAIGRRAGAEAVARGYEAAGGAAAAADAFERLL